MCEGGRTGPCRRPGHRLRGCWRPGQVWGQGVGSSVSQAKRGLRLSFCGRRLWTEDSAPFLIHLLEGQ